MEAPKNAVEAAEIRLGNWFEHLPEWSYRNETWKDPDRFVFQWEERDWFAIGECLFSLDRISPIPITAEILVKSGFSESVDLRDTKRYHKRATDFLLDFRESVGGVVELYINTRTDHARSLFVSTQMPHIKYVHQLQNIHYSLTGTELEIKWV